MENMSGFIIFENCSFFGGVSNYSLIQVFNSPIVIIDSFFSNNFNNLIFIDSSKLYVKNVTFQDNFCQVFVSGCLVTIEQNSFLIFDSVYVFNFTIDWDFPAINSDLSFMVFVNVHLNLITNSKNSKSFIFSTDSKIAISTSSFFNSQKNAFYFQNSMIFIKLSNFTAARSAKTIEKNENLISISSPIYSEDCVFAFTNSNMFSHLDAFDGGAITLYSSLLGQKAILINNTFANNNALRNGGSIYSLNINLIMINNNFSNNFATSGGAIYYENKLNSVDLILKGNNFLHNTASDQGGALKWEGLINLENIDNFYLGNSAIYGNDVAAYPTKIKMTILYKNRNICQYSEDNSSNFSNIYCVSSGNPIDYTLKFEIQDIYSNIVNNLNGKYFFVFNKILIRLDILS